MFFSLDRIEGTLAVLQDDDRREHVIPLAQLPDNARPGDVFRREQDNFVPDAEEADRRRRRIQELQRRLRRTQEGDTL